MIEQAQEVLNLIYLLWSQINTLGEQTFYFTPEEKSQLYAAEALLGDISYITEMQLYSFILSQLWRVLEWISGLFTPAAPMKLQRAHQTSMLDFKNSHEDI